MWYHPQYPPYMYPEHPPYEWPPMHAVRAQPPRAPAMYTEETREDVDESAEAAVARGFAALVDDLTVSMGRSLARVPVERRIVPFGGFARKRGETAAVRGAAPSASPFTVEIPVSVDTALSGQIKFLEWLTTQCATNVHHAHHAAFIAALSMARAAARYTRLMYRQTGGTGSVYDDPELQPVPDRAAALDAYRILRAFLEEEGKNRKSMPPQSQSLYDKAKAHVLHTDLSAYVETWREGK